MRFDTGHWLLVLCSHIIEPFILLLAGGLSVIVWVFTDRAGFRKLRSCERTRPPGLACLFQIATTRLCHMASEDKRFSHEQDK